MAKKLGTSVKVPKVYFYLWEVLNFWPSINFNSIRHGESTSTASKQTYTASQLSKDLNKVPLLLQNLGCSQFLFTIMLPSKNLIPNHKSAF